MLTIQKFKSRPDDRGGHDSVEYIHAAARVLAEVSDTEHGAVELYGKVYGRLEATAGFGVLVAVWFLSGLILGRMR
jgi:hypothetical protein